MKRLQLTGERAPGWHLHTHAQMNTCRRESLVLKHQNVSRPRNCLENKEQLFFKKKKTLRNILIITFLL